MKKILFLIVTGFLMMPYWAGSFISATPLITKWKGTKNIPNKDGGVTSERPPVEVDYNEISNTFEISFSEKSDRVEVNLYKDGALVYKDVDNADAQTTLNYEVNDTKPSAYNV